MEESVKINIPFGYAIDTEKSNFVTGDIVFRSIGLPRDWRDLKMKEQYCAQAPYYKMSININVSADGEPHEPCSFYTMSTKDEANAFAALGKLIQLRDAWWGDWRPVWWQGCVKHAISVEQGEILLDTCQVINHILVFPTAEMRDDFYNTFSALINTAKIFL